MSVIRNESSQSCGRIFEIFSSFQGEGTLVGRRQIFIRFAGCPLRCSYCDTPEARNFKAGTEMNVSEVLRCVKALATADLHSISFTGGEPLAQPSFLKEIASKTKSEGFKNYIETSGFNAKAFASVADFFDFASIDIKLSNHDAVSHEKYDELYGNEIETVRISAKKGLKTIVKVVVLKGTQAEEIERICKDIASFDVDFVLQPVSPAEQAKQAKQAEQMEKMEQSGERGMRRVEPPSIEEIFKLSEIAGQFIENVHVIPQMHKILGIS